jgi:hypothetical protein
VNPTLAIGSASAHERRCSFGLIVSPFVLLQGERVQFFLVLCFSFWCCQRAKFLLDIGRASNLWQILLRDWKRFGCLGGFFVSNSKVVSSITSSSLLLDKRAKVAPTSSKDSRTFETRIFRPRKKNKEKTTQRFLRKLYVSQLKRLISRSSLNSSVQRIHLQTFSTKEQKQNIFTLFNSPGTETVLGKAATGAMF